MAFHLYMPVSTIPYADRFGIGSPLVPMIDIGRALKSHKIPNLKKARQYLRSPGIGFSSSPFASPTWRRRVRKAVSSEGLTVIFDEAWLVMLGVTSDKARAAKYILEGAFAFASGEGITVPLILPLNPKKKKGAYWDALEFPGVIHYSPSPEFYLNLGFVPRLEDILKAKGLLTAKMVLRKTTAEGAHHHIRVKNCRLYLSAGDAGGVAWEPQWYGGTRLTLYKNGRGYVLSDSQPEYSWMYGVSSKKNNPPKPLPPEQAVDRMIDLHGSLGKAKWFAHAAWTDAKHDKHKAAERYWKKVVDAFTRRIKSGERG